MKIRIVLFICSMGVQALGLDIPSYMGEWNEIASIPQTFQKDCAYGTQADYKLLENNEIEVLNTCREKNGNKKSALGVARVNPKYEDSSKLQVLFFRPFGFKIWSLLSGDYWVLKLAEDLSWSVVGDPSKSYLWILSRSQSLPEKTLQDIEIFLKDYGYETCEILMSRRTEEELSSARLRLCDL